MTEGLRPYRSNKNKYQKSVGTVALDSLGRGTVADTERKLVAKTQ